MFAQGATSVAAPASTCGRGNQDEKDAVLDIAASHPTLSDLVADVRALDRATAS